jgi:hypothetical protein
MRSSKLLLVNHALLELQMLNVLHLSLRVELVPPGDHLLHLRLKRSLLLLNKQYLVGLRIYERLLPGSGVSRRDQMMLLLLGLVVRNLLECSLVLGRLWGLGRNDADHAQDLDEERLKLGVRVQLRINEGVLLLRLHGRENP